MPESLKERYDALDVEIKNLFRQNKEKPVPNYLKKLKKLIDEQDEIKIEMDLKDIKSDKKKGTEEDINIAYDIDSIRQIEKMRQAEQVEYENVEGYGRML